MTKHFGFKLIFSSLLLFAAFYTHAQTAISGRELLAKEPNFLKSRLKSSDSLYLQDINTIKKFIELDSIDLEILKPQILYSILSESKIDSTVTYKTLVDAVQSFKQHIGYSEFRKGILLYKQLATMKVNPDNWQNDQALFKRLGFTEADLEDFLLFISKPENKALNYKEAYLAYMREIDSLQ